jgi:hypothetical protein
MKSKLNKGMKSTYTYIAVLAALVVSARADFTSVADLAANDASYIAAVKANNLPEQAAIIAHRATITNEGAVVSIAQLNAALAQADVQAVLAPAAQLVIGNPALAANVNYEGMARAWLKTTAGETWAADHAAQVAPFLSNSPYQHLYLLNDYSTPEAFADWKATGYARPLGEVARLENIAFVAGTLGDWQTITAMDRSNFTYDVFNYPLYAKWAKAQAEGKSPKKDYDFIQKELVNVGMAGTAGSLPIVEHLGKLSQLLFNMIRQNAALQNP